MQSDSGNFSMGSVVIEPFLGLCTITALTQQDILGTSQLFYELQPQTERTPLVKIPASQMVARGVRPVMSESEMSDALSNLEEATDVSREPASLRMRHWVDRLRSGRPSSPPSVLRQLKQMQQRGVKLTPKELSLEQAVQLSFRQEIACVMQISEGQAGLRLVSALE
ncbi:hypothetical protein IV102_27700 [bacterium]|nr:hypothetical protein [bacterium]